MAATPRIIVVGGGLAGLSAVIKIAEAGGTVDLFSIVPVKRSHSVCAQGGINAAKDLKGEGDDVLKHFDDTDLWRRLSRQPDAGEEHDGAGAGDHRPAGPHGCAVQSDAGGAAGFSAVWWDAVSADGVCGGDDGAAAAVCAG